MKFKKALKFLVPIFGIATLSVALPLTLTSCSNSEDNNPIQFTENLPATSYATNSGGVILTVGANLNGQSSDNLYYKWFYKVNGAKDPNQNNDLEVNGYKLAIQNKQNDTNVLHVSAEQLKGYDVSFKCAVYENGNDTVVNWSNPTTVQMAKVVNSYNENDLNKYVNKLDATQVENAIAANDFKQIVVNANCGLTAEQIASVEPNIESTAPTGAPAGGGYASSVSSNTSNQFATLNNLVLSLTITLNPQYQFETGDRVVNVNNLKPNLKEIQINQPALDTAVANICKSDGCKSAQEVIQKHFATSEQIASFFTNGTANANSAQYIASATASVGTTANSPLQQIVFNLTAANGYLINGQKQISITAGTSFSTNPEALFLSNQNLERFITGLNLVQSVNANALAQGSVSYNAHGCVDGVHGGSGWNDNITNSKPHEEGFPPEVDKGDKDNAVNTVPNNKGGKLFNLIMAALGFNKDQAEKVEYVTIKRVNATNDEKVKCQNNGVGLNVPFKITVQLKAGATWANTNGSDTSSVSGRVNFSSMNGWTDYKAVFSNQPNDSLLTIYTNLVGVSVSVNMDQKDTSPMNTNLINLAPKDLGTFVNAVYPTFSSDVNKEYVLTPENNATQFNQVAKLLGDIPAGLFSKFIFKCNSDHQVEFKAVLIKGAVMYGPTTMHEIDKNWKITCEKIFCDENGNIPNWQEAVGQGTTKPNYQIPAGDNGKDHTMANPCKYAGFKITWKNDKAVDVSQANIQKLIKDFNAIDSANANQIYNESMTINNPSSSATVSKKANLAVLEEEDSVLDPATKKDEIFNKVLADLGITSQSQAVKSITLSRAPNGTTFDNVYGSGIDLPLNITVTLNPGYTFGNNSGLTSWQDKDETFAAGSGKTTEYIATFNNDTTAKGNSVLTIATNEVGILLGINFGQNATGNICFNQSKLNAFAKSVYTQIKMNTTVPMITSKDPKFIQIAKELGLPAQIFSGFLFKEGSDKKVTITCFLKNGIDFSGGSQFQSSGGNQVTVKKGQYKPDGSQDNGWSGKAGMQITWTNNQ